MEVSSGVSEPLNGDQKEFFLICWILGLEGERVIGTDIVAEQGCGKGPKTCCKLAQPASTHSGWGWAVGRQSALCLRISEGQGPGDHAAQG